MDFESSFVIVGGIVSFMALVLILVLIFYKPGKKLEVTCSRKDQAEEKIKVVTVQVKNTGKKRIKIVAPFVSFYNIKHAEVFQIDPKKVKCKFPRILKVGDEVSCEVEIGHYRETIEKKDFDPTRVKIFVKDTVGMKFNSNSVDFHL